MTTGHYSPRRWVDGCRRWMTGEMFGRWAWDDRRGWRQVVDNRIGFPRLRRQIDGENTWRGSFIQQQVLSWRLAERIGTGKVLEYTGLFRGTSHGMFFFKISTPKAVLSRVISAKTLQFLRRRRRNRRRPIWLKNMTIMAIQNISNRARLSVVLLREGTVCFLMSWLEYSFRWSGNVRGSCY